MLLKFGPGFNYILHFYLFLNRKVSSKNLWRSKKKFQRLDKSSENIFYLNKLIIDKNLLCSFLKVYKNGTMCVHMVFNREKDWGIFLLWQKLIWQKLQKCKKGFSISYGNFFASWTPSSNFFFYIMFFAISCFVSLKKDHFESIFFTMAHLCYMIMGKFLPFDWQANRLNQRDMMHRSVRCMLFI